MTLSIAACFSEIGSQHSNRVFPENVLLATHNPELALCATLSLKTRRGILSPPPSSLVPSKMANWRVPAKVKTESSQVYKWPSQANPGSAQADRRPSQGSMRPSPTDGITSWVHSSQFRARTDRQRTLSEQHRPSHTDRLLPSRVERGPLEPYTVKGPSQANTGTFQANTGLL